PLLAPVTSAVLPESGASFRPFYLGAARFQSEIGTQSPGLARADGTIPGPQAEGEARTCPANQLARKLNSHPSSRMPPRGGCPRRSASVGVRGCVCARV